MAPAWSSLRSPHLHVRLHHPARYKPYQSVRSNTHQAWRCGAVGKQTSLGNPGLFHPLRAVAGSAACTELGSTKTPGKDTGNKRVRRLNRRILWREVMLSASRRWPRRGGTTGPCLAVSRRRGIRSTAKADNRHMLPSSCRLLVSKNPDERAGIGEDTRVHGTSCYHFVHRHSSELGPFLRDSRMSYSDIRSFYLTVQRRICDYVFSLKFRSTRR